MSVKPASDDTEFIRRNRSRRLTAGILSGVLTRFAAVAFSLLTVPFALSYLGDAQFGLWMTLVSFTAMAAFADLGIGNGLLTKASESLAQGDIEKTRRYVSSGYRILTQTSLVLAGVAVLVITLGGEDIIRALASDVSPSTGKVMLLLIFLAFTAQIPLGIVLRVQYACQEITQANLWTAFGAATSFLGVVAVVKTDAGPTALVAAAAFGPVVAALGNTVWVFGHTHPELRPRWSEGTRAASRELLSMGLLFFVVSILTSISLNIDNTLISMARGSAAVANYSIAVRAFSILSLFVTLLTLPLWPALTEALTRKDIVWTRRIVKKISLLLLVGVSIGALTLVAFRRPLLKFWMHTDIPVPLTLALGLAAWSLLLALVSPWFMVQNSAGMVRIQVFGWIGFLIASITWKWFHLANGSLSFLPWISVACYSLIMVPTAYYGYRRAIAAALSAEPTTERVAK